MPHALLSLFYVSWLILNVFHFSITETHPDLEERLLFLFHSASYITRIFFYGHPSSLFVHQSSRLPIVPSLMPFRSSPQSSTSLETGAEELREFEIESQQRSTVAIQKEQGIHIKKSNSKQNRRYRKETRAKNQAGTHPVLRNNRTNKRTHKALVLSSASKEDFT